MPSVKPPFELQENVSLAPLTTLEVGGATRYMAQCRDLRELQAALEWAQDHRLPVFTLGGGSNLLVADEGFNGLTVRYLEDTWSHQEDGEDVVLRLGAGVVWDRAVQLSVERGWAGIECLSGIPGWVGAAPLQNIGAYGQEVAESLTAVEGLEVASGRAMRWPAADCGFGYRSSFFKGCWRGQYLITNVELRLRRGAPRPIRYGELARRLEALDEVPSLEAIRRTVLSIRASKSMLLSDDDENRRSAGSFFVNPEVPRSLAAAAQKAWAGRGGEGEMPTFEAGGGRVKLSAAWLIERAGFERGYGLGAAGLSSRHTLALVNRGGARAAEIVALAREIRAGVYRAFGVRLVPEPHFLGFAVGVDKLLGNPEEAQKAVGPMIDGS